MESTKTLYRNGIDEASFMPNSEYWNLSNKQAIYELLDNICSSNQSLDNESTKVLIKLIAKGKNVTKTIINDTGSGINHESFKNVGTMGQISTIKKNNSIHAYGSGLTMALSVLGDSYSIISTHNGITSEVKDVKARTPNEVPITTETTGNPNGTKITIVHDDSYALYTDDVEDLCRAIGFRYNRYISSNRITFDVEVVDLLSGTTRKLNVHADSPITFDYTTFEPGPFIDMKEISGKGWSAKVTIGMKYHAKDFPKIPYKNKQRSFPSKAHQGIDIYFDDRVITTIPFSKLYSKAVPHNRYNYFSISVDCITGFTVNLIKTSVREDKNWRELIKSIAKVLDSDFYVAAYDRITRLSSLIPKLAEQRNRYYKQKGQYPLESVLIERFMDTENFKEWYSHYEREVHLSKYNCRYDLLALDTTCQQLHLYEFKRNKISIRDIFQLLGYLTLSKRNIKYGFLVAHSFPEETNDILDQINRNSPYTIDVFTHKQLGINTSPMSDEEIYRHINLDK